MPVTATLEHAPASRTGTASAGCLPVVGSDTLVPLVDGRGPGGHTFLQSAVGCRSACGTGG